MVFSLSTFRAVVVRLCVPLVFKVIATLTSSKVVSPMLISAPSLPGPVRGLFIKGTPFLSSVYAKVDVIGAKAAARVSKLREVMDLRVLPPSPSINFFCIWSHVDE